MALGNSKAKTIKGKFHVEMTRPSGGPPERDGCWELRIVDDASRDAVFRCIVTPEALSDILSSRMGTPCDGTLFVSQRHGKQHECKTVRVVVPADAPKREDYDARALAAQMQAEAENPGWEADAERWNHHRAGSDGKYAVVLRRWV